MTAARRAVTAVDPMSQPLFPMKHLEGDAVHAARSLLGALVVSNIGDTLTAGRIVETEAYFGPRDPASHAAARTGRTERNEPMYGPAGTAYIYRIYGVHLCLNIVTDQEEVGSAVLVRALEPVTGLETMVERRGRKRNLCTGPGRLVQALGIDLSLNCHSLDSEPLTLRVGANVPRTKVRTTGRVGVSRATDWPLRFFIAGSTSVSGARARASTHSRSYANALAKHREEVAAG